MDPSLRDTCRGFTLPEEAERRFRNCLDMQYANEVLQAEKENAEARGWALAEAVEVVLAAGIVQRSILIDALTAWKEATGA